MDQAFLFMVDEVVHMCSLESQDIFKICTIQFIPFAHFETEKELFNTPRGKDIQYHISNMRQLFDESGYYFSYTYDLSLSKIQ